MRFVLVGVLSCLFAVNGMAEQRVNQDFHLTTYAGQQGVISDIELFTKHESREVFFGITCSSMSPFPLIQVLLFNDEVISETPRFLRVSYLLDGPNSEGSPKLQGILKPVDTFEERSNKIRLELEPDHIRSLSGMNQGYEVLLQRLQSSKQVVFTFNSGAIGTHTYEFSLNGLSTLLEPYQSVCR